jgi:hypothetical protein
LIQKQDFSLSIALDGGSVLVTYPYDKPVQTGMLRIGFHMWYLILVGLSKSLSNVPPKSSSVMSICFALCSNNQPYPTARKEFRQIGEGRPDGGRVAASGHTCSVSSTFSKAVRF